jgi:hypothetical protein
VLGIVATVTANAVYGASHGPVGVVVNMWPAVAFLVSSEILIGMLRARPGQAPEAVPERRSRTVAARPAPTRIEARRDPAKVFREELAAGQVPSLRAVSSSVMWAPTGRGSSSLSWLP